MSARMTHRWSLNLLLVKVVLQVDIAAGVDPGHGAVDHQLPPDARERLAPPIPAERRVLHQLREEHCRTKYSR